MRKLILFFISGLLLGSCQKGTERTLDQSATTKLMPVDSINYFIRREWERTGQFQWKNASDRMLWGALAHADFLVSLGFYPNEMQTETIGADSLSTGRARQRLLDWIYELEKSSHPDINRDSLEVWPEPLMPYLSVRITSYETMLRLRHSPWVRYLEPMNYETHLDMGQHNRQSGCGANLPDFRLTAGVDYGVVSPFSKASWNYPYHGVLDAWRNVSGAGITIFLIDTGIGKEQENLGTQFNQGWSQKRRIEKMVTLPRRQFWGVINVGPAETPEDRCGHGTAMAGVMAAPRGTDGNMVGVAYNSNLISCRAAEDVFIDEAREVQGVSQAFVRAAGRSDVRIISMSMGRITTSSQIRDAILYAHSKGKLIFGAAGTSFSFTAGWYGVIFPASMSEVQAVTGIRPGTDPAACSTCHSGPEVDFVVVMERASDKRHPLTVADSGDWPSTVGGSSVATASMAGMAALAWSRYPWFSAAQLLQVLQTNSNYFPNRHPQWGWGIFQSARAVN